VNRPRVRQIPLLGAIVALAVAVAVGVDARLRSGRIITTTTTTHYRPSRHGQAPLRVAGRSVVVIVRDAPQSESDEEPLLLGLLGASAGLLLAYAFFNRLTEITILGMTLKLGPELVNAVSEITERAPDSETQSKMLREFAAAVLGELANKRELVAGDVQRAKEEAIDQVVEDPAGEVTVERADGQLQPEIDRVSASDFRVTTAEQYLPEPVFGDLAERVMAAPGRSVCVVDEHTGMVVAALSYLPLHAGEPLVIDALVSSPGQSSLLAAGLAIRYADAIREKLGGTEVLWRFDQPPDQGQTQMLTSLAFEPAADTLVANLPAGYYWRLAL
jgi:hypothetical protein